MITKGELRYVEMVYGALCVVHSGDRWMLKWSAGNLDTQQMVLKLNSACITIRHEHKFCPLFLSRSACILGCILRSRSWSHFAT